MYSWDEHKNRANQRKHALSFEEAVQVFHDPFHVTSLPGSARNEARWQTVGALANAVEVLVIHTSPAATEEAGGAIRIISARRVNACERREFAAHPADQPMQVLGHAAVPSARGWFGADGYRTRKRRP